MNRALLKARKAAGLSRAQLDAAAGLANGATYDIEMERSKTPAYDTAVRILRVLERHGVPQKHRDQIFPVGEVAGAGR